MCENISVGHASMLTDIGRSPRKCVHASFRRGVSYMSVPSFRQYPGKHKYCSNYYIYSKHKHFFFMWLTVSVPWRLDSITLRLSQPKQRAYGTSCRDFFRSHPHLPASSWTISRTHFNWPSREECICPALSTKYLDVLFSLITVKQ